MGDWLESQLFEKRTLRLVGPLDDEKAGRIAAALMTMDAQGDELIDLHLSSDSGSLDAALVLIDAIDLLGVPVRTTALGVVAGPAAFVLALSPRRRATAHASIRLVEPEVDHKGQADELVRAANESRARLDALTERLADVTRRPPEEIAGYVESRRTFTATEAVEARLVDEVVTAANGLRPA